MAKRIFKEILEQVVIGDIVDGGRCIAQVDNLVLFVKQVAPGDIVDLRVVSKKKNYAEAVPVYTHKTSRMRVPPVCQHFGTCGGCHWQHVSYAEQLAAKERLVLEKLVHIGHIKNPCVAPILAANPTEYYRNKLEFTFSNNRWLSATEIEEQAQFDRRALGFHKPGHFDKVVDIAHCHLQPTPSNAIRNSLTQFAKTHELSFYDLRHNNGLLRNLIIRTTSTQETMAIVQFGQTVEDKIKQVMYHLKTQFPQLTSLQYVVNTKKHENFYDLPVHLYYGQTHVIEQLGDLKFQIGPKSFFQTNTTQAKVLYRKVEELAGLHADEILYDLYTGVGSIAIFLAQHVHHAVGIDVTAEAIADAQSNARLNNVANTTFVVGAVEKLLNSQFLSTYGRPNVIVIDPPRAGIHPKVVTQLLRLLPNRIIYVSCNPATQARDIAHLCEKYRLVASQPVDMFPHTAHVENVVLLARQF